MKQLYVRYIPSLNDVDLELANEMLDEYGNCGSIDRLNWSKQYPYKPITIFSIARSEDSILIKFNVHGSMLKAVYSQDQSPVYEDSCVEFFCKLADNEYYTNFEFNCIGTCSASRRKSRNEKVTNFSLDELSLIKRYSSLGRRVFKEMEGMFEWDLTVKIPFSLIGIDPKNIPEYLFANFYKCADNTDSPHYVTWNPIISEKPDFHRPECFGKLIFE